MEWNKELDRFVWTKEDWLFALPAIVGGFSAVGFILLCRWLYLTFG